MHDRTTTLLLEGIISEDILKSNQVEDVENEGKGSGSVLPKRNPTIKSPKVQVNTEEGIDFQKSMSSK